MMIMILLCIALVSFLLALRSMHDMHIPKELERLISNKKIKGSIVFFKDKVIHYRGKGK